MVRALDTGSLRSGLDPHRGQVVSLNKTHSLPRVLVNSQEAVDQSQQN